MSEEKNSTKVGHTVTGRVISNKMLKTITVLVERQVRHPKYGKILRRSSKLHAHDEDGVCGLGDLVSIRAGRRRSATKNWELVSVLQKASLADQGEAATAAAVSGV